MQNFVRGFLLALHPFLLPIYATLFFFNFTFVMVQPLWSLIVILSISAFFSLVLPSTVDSLSMNVGSMDQSVNDSTEIVGSVSASSNERFLGTVVFALSMIICSVALFRFSGFGFFVQLHLSFSFAAILVGFVSQFRKFSLQMAVMGAWIGTVYFVWQISPLITYVYFPLMSFSLLALLCAFVASALLHVGQHSPLVLLLSFCSGVVASFFVDMVQN